MYLCMYACMYVCVCIYIYMKYVCIYVCKYSLESVGFTVFGFRVLVRISPAGPASRKGMFLKTV